MGAFVMQKQIHNHNHNHKQPLVLNNNNNSNNNINSIKRKNRPPIGLRNLGNSCYLNSVLQCLTYTPPLANFCLSNLHSQLCDSVFEPDKKRDCPFCILERRIVRSLSIELNLDTPSKIVNCLQIFSKHFKGGRQEDAHEFLRYVIDACHNTCLRLKKLQQHRSKKSINGGGGGGETDGSSVVKQIFGGALQSQVKCLSCGTESNKVDEIMDISLEVSVSNSLKEAMKRFFQAEILDGNNKYSCERCKKLVPAKKQMSILEAPNVLVIQLKRFEGIFGGKIDRVIAFDEVLLLSSFMCKESLDSHPEYSLFATIVHSGFSPDSGHYYAYIKDAMGRWYCCNDSYVTLSTLQEVLSEKAYILFFTRTSQRPVSTNKGAVSSGVKSHGINGALSADTTVISNGLKSHHSNGSGTFNYSNEDNPAKAMNVRSSTSLPMVQSIQLPSKVGDASATVQNKFTGLSFSLAKKASGGSNVKADVKRKSGDKNGSNGHCTFEQVNGKNLDLLENSTSDYTDQKDNVVMINHPVVNGNGLCQNGSMSPVEGDHHFLNGVKDKVTSGAKLENGASCSGGAVGLGDTSCLNRKLGDSDSCVLLAKDAQSQARVEEFKKSLQLETASVLQSCGWTDRVYKYMSSRKRMCVDDHTSDGNEPKKRLIADAKATFLRQIPGSLKASLIERLKSFSGE